MPGAMPGKLQLGEELEGACAVHTALRGAVVEAPVREAEGAGPVGDQGALVGEVEGAETGAGEHLGHVGEALRVPF